MQPEIEARYLGLEWLERGQARRVEVAPDPLPLERGVDDVLRVESLIFNDFHPWLGLRLSGRLSHSKPAFVDAQGSRRPMLAVDDHAGNTWWVQDDGWDEGRKRHFSELHRTMGRFEVHIGDERLLIDNQATGLGQAQIDEYLQDFKGDLLWLVLGSGTGTVSAGSSPVGNELVAALSDFATTVAKVAARPARTLREISADTPRSRLRPNAASFRQHARTPTSSHLVGRLSEETADTADNRYLRQIVQVCSRLAGAAAKATQQQATRFVDRAHFEHERGAAYAAAHVRAVDPEIFDRQLAEIEQKLDELAAWPDAPQGGQGEGSQGYDMQITGRYGRQTNEFFYKKVEGHSDYDVRNDIRYNVVRLPELLAKRVTAALNFCKEYTLSGQPAISLENYTKGQYRLVNFMKVTAVKPDRHAIAAKLRTRERLEGKGWQRELSQAERAEMQREARTAALRAQTYREVGEYAKTAGSELAACQAALRREDAHWQSLGVLPQPAFPMGMRYALSPDYAAVLKIYTRVRTLADSAGMGDGALDELNRINILHASAIYERWCLVKIIGVLIGDFRFEPNPGWQDVVIRAVTGRPDSTSVLFHRRDGISAKLEIQPLLENGRRPDFRLHFNSGDEHSSAIVLDAKFRARWRPGALSALLTDLVESKGYGQRGDRVFILQPQAHAVSEPTSPLIWGRHCDYGQDSPANHRRGTIHLAAGAQDGGTQHNLRRLIAMELQAVFPNPSSEGTTWTSKSFCIRCGTQHTPGDIEHKATRRGKSYWELRCNDCRMLTVRTHCYDCGESLFKNGTDLSYHRTLADQITNVVCPKCGAFFDQDIDGG